ncbi:DUF4139 domain-containing protein [Coralloluteibacterium thermophilus]
MPSPSRDAAGATRLTVYSGDFEGVNNAYPGEGMPGLALVSQTLRRQVPAGDGELAVTGLPRALDAGTVALAPQDGGVQVRGQRYEFALAGQEELLQRSIGRPIEVSYSTGGSRQTDRGVLLAAGNGLTLRLDSGRIKVLREYDSFDLVELPGGLNAQPTLRWQLAADAAGERDFLLDYATGGLAWRAEYRAVLAGADGACRMDFAGSAQVANRSGAAFADAELTLVAGEPNRTAKVQPRMERMQMAAAPMAADVAGAPEPLASGEYHAYTLPGRTDLPDGSVQQVPLLDAARGVACERRYETRNGVAGWTPPRPIVQRDFNLVQGRIQVGASLRFRNDAEAGLGRPLPEGRVRMFDGADFLGEATLHHTPVGAEVALPIGNVFDLSGERRREDFRLDSAGRTMTERFVVTLRNARDAAATVRVVEGLPRWSEWEIVEAGGRTWTREDAHAVATEVEVPANGEAAVTYTVRYRWAADVQPQ